MADVWANSMACHSRATYHIAGCSHLTKSMSLSCHTAGCKNFIRHIENRFSTYFILFFVFNAVLALASGGFRIVSDTLVINGLVVCLSVCPSHASIESKIQTTRERERERDRRSSYY